LVLNGDCDPFFMRYYILGSRKYLEENASGTTFKELSGAAMGQLIAPVPPLDVQRRIVARIDELFAEIEEGERGISEAAAQAEVYRRACMKAATTGALTSGWRAANPARETGSTLLGRILDDRRRRWASEPRTMGRRYVEPAPVRGDLPTPPAGWCWATLQQLAFVSGGIAVDGKRRPSRPMDVPYLRVANVQRGRLDLSKMKSITIDEHDFEALRLQDGDLLLNEGGDRDKVGRGWVWRSELPACVHQNHVFKARPVSDLVRPELVSTYLNELGRGFFLDESKQTTNLASISLSKISAAPVLVPPPAEADLILDLMHQFTANPLLEEIEAAAVSAATLRQSILAAAFRGDLVA
jgi:type I restriction enzyme S subunit